VKSILDYLKIHGESLDTEIAKAISSPLINVHQNLTELSAKGQVMTCHATRYSDGNKHEVMICRLVGQGPFKKPITVKKTSPMLKVTINQSSGRVTPDAR